MESALMVTDEVLYLKQCRAKLRDEIASSASKDLQPACLSKDPRLQARARRIRASRVPAFDRPWPGLILIAPPSPTEDERLAEGSTPASVKSDRYVKHSAVSVAAEPPRRSVDRQNRLPPLDVSAAGSNALKAAERPDEASSMASSYTRRASSSVQGHDTVSLDGSSVTSVDPESPWTPCNAGQISHARVYKPSIGASSIPSSAVPTACMKPSGSNRNPSPTTGEVIGSPSVPFSSNAVSQQPYSRPRRRFSDGSPAEVITNRSSGDSSPNRQQDLSVKSTHEQDPCKDDRDGEGQLSRAPSPQVRIFAQCKEPTPPPERRVSSEHIPTGPRRPAYPASDASNPSWNSYRPRYSPDSMSPPPRRSFSEAFSQPRARQPRDRSDHLAAELETRNLRDQPCTAFAYGKCHRGSSCKRSHDWRAYLIEEINVRRLLPDEAEAHNPSKHSREREDRDIGKIPCCRWVATGTCPSLYSNFKCTFGHSWAQLVDRNEAFRHYHGDLVYRLDKEEDCMDGEWDERDNKRSRY